MNLLLTDQESNRLQFRRVKKDDYNLWLPLFKEKNVDKFLGMPTGLSQKEQCDFWFNKVWHRYENNLGGMNALIDKATGHFIGQAGLLIQTVDHEKRLEVGYSILPEFWGQGYAQEAAKTCRDFCFKNEFSNHLISMMHVDNIASEMVAIKNGMSLEKQVDEFKVFSMTRAEWLLL
ncbi:GNAT family N-acetyltransferase [Psychroserpens damuponensis]|uniref:GNAT family N-acetyltransferase n=1 Tax=Psychroserpens damuponensis TaxID=943936 RepID=UPI0006944044|nr:GNAT family N-acetyltransferase [Psychroserpens damuponensis]